MGMKKNRCYHSISYTRVHCDQNRGGKKAVISLYRGAIAGFAQTAGI
jgi:hypothetical protein